MATPSFRDLREDELECRVARATEKGVQLLVYKDARVDMNVLDETVGPQNWQKRFYEHKNTLFCSVGINVADTAPGTALESEGTRFEPCWVWKDDAGSPSNMESEKGEASDAFKRACFNWGIGRELYTSPFIWVQEDRCNVKTGRNGKPQCFDHFRVEKIRVEGGRITGLSIWNETKACRAFVWQDAAHSEKVG